MDMHSPFTHRESKRQKKIHVFNGYRTIHSYLTGEYNQTREKRQRERQSKKGNKVNL
jgi:hypothetical protein